MEGLVFEEHPDDIVRPTGTFEVEFQQVVTEASWRDPERFGYLESPFENHIAMIAKRSEELGIVNEYSAELINLREDIQNLQTTMMSFDEFRQMVCACPEEFGMSTTSTASVFGSEADHSGHGHDDDPLARHDHDEEDEDEDDEEDEHDHRRKLGRAACKH